MDDLIRRLQSKLRKDPKTYGPRVAKELLEALTELNEKNKELEEQLKTEHERGLHVFEQLGLSELELKQHKWISVEDELPEPGRTVLVYR